jgi:GTP-binding protein SAR1
MWSVITWVRSFIPDYTWFWWGSGDSKSNTILLIGLDDAGKTTLTGRLTQNRLIQASPTGKPCTHEVKFGSTLLAVTDIGGHQQVRRLWREYMFASTRLIFIIDASNRQRLPEARYELLNILNDDDIKSVPLLILANKIDNIQTAYSESELIYQLDIGKYLSEENPRVKICMCSISRNEGFGDGLRWLIKQQIKSDN